MAQALVGGAAQNSGASSTLSSAPTQESPDEWRASKLAGIGIYGPDNKKVGDISDVLMTKDGKVDYVVVGVGGFLGIGQKDVAIPYGQVTFTDQPMTQTGAATGGGMAGGGIAPATSVGTPTNTSGNAPVPPPRIEAARAGAAADQIGAYPDHGMINMTADQLKNAPSFHFAR